MNPTLSPAQLNFLLHCYTQADTEFDLSMYKDEIAQWVEAGILKRDEPHGSTIAAGYIYRTTPRGEAWVKLILKTQMPSVAFVDEHGVII